MDAADEPWWIARGERIEACEGDSSGSGIGIFGNEQPPRCRGHPQCADVARRPSECADEASPARRTTVISGADTQVLRAGRPEAYAHGDGEGRSDRPIGLVPHIPQISASCGTTSENS
jgi:hypothetical protein